MGARVHGATLRGIEGIPVTVEVDAGRGLPGFQIVGRADPVVNESRDRIRAAFRRAGLEFPPGRVTVNLAPTELPKSGAGLDLAIAVGVAAARLPLDPARLQQTLFVGELALDGALRGVRGALALVSAACVPGRTHAVVAGPMLAEAAPCPRIEALGAADLGEVLAWLRGERALERAVDLPPPAPAAPGPDLADVRGQALARRALEIAAAGAHHVLLVGPPGSGKTLLARRLPGLLPPLEPAASLEVTRIHGVAGTLATGCVTRPPLRAPHHTTSAAGLIGGGRPPRPGEVTLAHCGVLFLDELPEFQRTSLEALREPLEEGIVRIVRAQGALRLPARFQLVAAMNPCPCGWYGDAARDCVCDDARLSRYRARVSGPLLDRIDLVVPVSPVPWRELEARPDPAQTSAAARARVSAARAQQTVRGGLNARLVALPDAPELALARDARRLLERAVDGLGLSMRGLVRVLRVARTISDLAGEAAVSRAALAEALAFRPLVSDATPGRS